MARRRNLRSSAPRRRMFWANANELFSAGPSAAPVSSEPYDLLANFREDYGADLFGFTVTRIRGLLRFAYDQTTVVERHDASFGIRVANDNLPDVVNDEAERLLIAPTGDPHADWMWLYNDSHYTNVAATGSYAQYEVPIDIKAQRRLDELGQSLFFLGAFGGADFEAFVNVTVALRVLCKRP